MRSRVGDFSTNVEFVVLPKVTIDLPATCIDISSWNMPPGIHLADPSFYKTSQVDIVIGAEIFFELFRVPGRIPLGDNLPVLVNSALGWVVCGKADVNSSTPVVVHFATTTSRPLPEAIREDAFQTAQDGNAQFSYRQFRNDPHPPKSSSPSETQQLVSTPTKGESSSHALGVNIHRINHLAQRTELAPRPNINNKQLNHLRPSTSSVTMKSYIAASTTTLESSNASMNQPSSSSALLAESKCRCCVPISFRNPLSPQPNHFTRQS
ncbi:hypothetical protein RP20_CCG023661 [Aedes albopictus]|nr:hypothetical protein RP20_CCG023661 [Aedes albopictus]